MFPGSITDIAGIAVGHHTDPRRPTGCTVALCPQGAVCGVDVRGAAPGTRETDLLAPGNLVDRVHAVLLAGGSAFGLDAAGGVMRWLDEHGHGFTVGPARVPIVPAAVLFDLWLGDARIRPDADAGYAACEAASDRAPAQGSVGAGAGATVGKVFGIAHAMKGGIGSASLEVHGVRVAALVAVNGVGDVIDPGTARVVAGSRQLDGRTPRRITQALARGLMPPNILAGSNTTIGIVATDAALDKAQCARLATASHDGLARCIDPVHTASDGDTMFALATGNATGTQARALPLTVLGALVAEVTQRAVLNAVRAAVGEREPPLPSAQDLGWA
ncbi:MAG TPA: P1 family peptidase [Burkholderiaceae bacterium]|nr:P1 family peptidase [Burkholderiaceae bacterium]